MSCGCYFSRWRNEVSSPQGFSHSALHPLTQAFHHLPPSSCIARRHSENGCPFKALRNCLAQRSSLLHAWPCAHSTGSGLIGQPDTFLRPAKCYFIIREASKVQDRVHRLFQPSFVVAHLVWSSWETEHKVLHWQLALVPSENTLSLWNTLESC